MALQSAMKSERTGGKRVEQAELEVGNYPCRVAQVIDMGLHHKDVWDEANKKYVKATDKAPVNMIMLTYEFTSEYMKDEAGNELEDKPRWLSEDFAIHALDSDLATSTKRMKAFDPKFDKYRGDWSAIAGQACTVTIAHKKNGKAKIGNVSPPMKGFPVPELKNPVKVFDVENPDMDIFKSLPQWLQDRIKSNLEYEGSALQAALEGGVQKPKQESKPAPQEPEIAQDEDDDIPW